MNEIDHGLKWKHSGHEPWFCRLTVRPSSDLQPSCHTPQHISYDKTTAPPPMTTTHTDLVLFHLLPQVPRFNARLLHVAQGHLRVNEPQVKLVQLIVQLLLFLPAGGQSLDPALTLPGHLQTWDSLLGSNPLNYCPYRQIFTGTNFL